VAASAPLSRREAGVDKPHERLELQLAERRQPTRTTMSISTAIRSLTRTPSQSKIRSSGHDAFQPIVRIVAEPRAGVAPGFSRRSE